MEKHESNTSARRAGAVRAATIVVGVTGCCILATLPGGKRSDKAPCSSTVYAQAVNDSTKERHRQRRKNERAGSVSVNAYVAPGSEGGDRTADPGNLSTGLEPGVGFTPSATESRKKGWTGFSRI